MADEEVVTVEIQDNFYHDSIGKVIIAFIAILIAISMLVAISLYLHYTKPTPTTFFVDREWRVQSAVPVDQPYLSEPDMLQWVGETLPRVFVYDFSHYNDQLKANQQFFTPNGWNIFLNQLNNYASYNYVSSNKLFVTGNAAGAPYIINQGLLSGRYAWWVQMPVTINYATYTPSTKRTLTLQVLVVRVSTLNNLNGVAIDNVIVTNATNITGVAV